VNWKPVICAAHGYVLGLALGIALECDLIVAEEGTKFQVTEAPRGLSGAKYWALLNFRGGGSLAVKVSLTGEFFTAEQALAVNIVDQVAPKGEYLAAAQALGRAIAKNPPLGVRHTVQLRRWELKKVQQEAVRTVRAAKLNLSEDFLESARAFVEKRPAGPFKGR
jgi:enoyl-CoA hydratase/carnithine racemase